MTAHAPVASNPLARAALTVSPTANVVGAVARVIGAGFALLYAWNQYAEFDRLFERTWVFTVAIALIALATIVVLARAGWMGRVAMAAGAAGLLFGGAMLAREVEGQAVLLAGLVAWLASAATESRERGSSWFSVLGLAVGAAFTFAIAISTALLPS